MVDAEALRRGVMEKMTDLITTKFAVPREVVAPEASLRGTLGLDSLDIVELEGSLERHYKLRSRLENYSALETVGAVRDYLVERLVERSNT